MTLWKNYHLAHDITDALQVLANAPGEARLIAGGTDLLLDIQQGRHPAIDTLVDITRVPAMTGIEIRAGQLFLGAAVPLSKILASPLVRSQASALAEAAALIGGPQVRNTATLGGNVGHALPAGDGTIALLALGAEAEIASLEEVRRLPIEELFLSPGESVLDRRHELLSGFYLPLKTEDEGSAFRRVMRPQGVAIAILNMGVWVQRRENRIADLRIAIGPAGPKPFRARAAEDDLRGKHFEEPIFHTANHAILAEARFRTSPHRATVEYRRELITFLLRETLTTAWMRAARAAENLLLEE